MTGPRALIIGRRGQVAQALARSFGNHGIAYTIAARPDIDLEQPQTIIDHIAALRPDVVINPAAYTAVDRAEDERELAFAINASAAGAVAIAASGLDVPLIHFSTDYVFDGRNSLPYVETDVTGPLGVYGQSKLSGERAVAAANLKSVVLRTAWVCGPDGTNFVKTMLRLAATRPELRVVDDQYGAPTFAADIAEAVVTIVRRMTSPHVAGDDYGIFHLASAGETTWCGFARAIMTGSARRGGPHVPVAAITTADFPTKAMRPIYSKLNMDKLSARYGVALPVWNVGLEHCLDALVGKPKDYFRSRKEAK